MAASPNMHQHFDCLGSEEHHIAHFLHVQTASHLNWLVKYHRNFPFDLGFTRKTRARFGSFWKSLFVPSDVAHQDTLVQVIHTVIFAMQKCQVPISSGLALGFLGSHMGMTPPLIIRGQVRVGWATSIEKSPTLDVSFWGNQLKVLSWMLDCCKRTQLSLEITVAASVFGRHLKRLNISQYLRAVLELKCCNAHMSAVVITCEPGSCKIHGSLIFNTRHCSSWL